MIRLGAQIVASVGVSKVVNDIITNNTVVTTTMDAVRVWAGSLVIGSMVADAASQHVDKRISDAMEWYNKKQTETATS
jgi:hypothetical protein